MTGKKERTHFFFEKKKQKTFASKEARKRRVQCALALHQRCGHCQPGASEPPVQRRSWRGGRVLHEGGTRARTMVTLCARLRVEQTKAAQSRTRLIVARRPENQKQHDDKVENESMFFFEKKNQKTFANWAAANPEPQRPDGARPNDRKSFGSFLQKRTSSFSSYP
jgi:hypothetical protein